MVHTVDGHYRTYILLLFIYCRRLGSNGANYITSLNFAAWEVRQKLQMHLLYNQNHHINL